MRPPTTTSPDETIKWRVKLMVLEKWGTRGERNPPPPPPTHTPHGTARHRPSAAGTPPQNTAKVRQTGTTNRQNCITLSPPFPNPLPGLVEPRRLMDRCAVFGYLVTLALQCAIHDSPRFTVGDITCRPGRQIAPIPRVGCTGHRSLAHKSPQQ